MALRLESQVPGRRLARSSTRVAVPAGCAWPSWPPRSLGLAHGGLDRLAVAVPAPERAQPGGARRGAVCGLAGASLARRARRRRAERRATPRRALLVAPRLASSCARSVRSSRSEHCRARLPAPVKRSHARAKLAEVGASAAAVRGEHRADAALAVACTRRR